MEVFSDLPDHAWKRGTQQFLHTGRPGVIPTVNFKIVDPLRKNKGIWSPPARVWDCETFSNQTTI